MVGKHLTIKSLKRISKLYGYGVLMSPFKEYITL